MSSRLILDDLLFVYLRVTGSPAQYTKKEFFCIPHRLSSFVPLALRVVLRYKKEQVPCTCSAQNSDNPFDIRFELSVFLDLDHRIRRILPFPY